MTWTDFKKAFQDKYSPRSFYDSKRNEFLRLVQGSRSVAKYEKKFTELAKYAMVVIADEIDRCKQFEEVFQKEIQTLVTASAKWSDFAKLVKASMRVEKNLA